MALNKSNKSTPSSRNGYCELSASTGKQNNFLFPVRIKVTPNSRIGSFSDGKKNHSKMLQPVLIKDLLQSNQKERQHSKIISVSTQKKKLSSQNSIQPWSRQSYYKSKKEEVEESNFFNRESYNGNKVRRQLYQTLDYSQQSVFDGKDNTNKVSRMKKKIFQDSEEQTTQSISVENKNRQSFLLPLNTIKNSFIRKSTSNKININSQTVKNNTGSVNKQMKRPASIIETKELKNNNQNIYTNGQGEVNMKPDFSSCFTVRDNCTMTSPTIDKFVPLNKSLSAIEINKKLNITNSTELKSEVEHSINLKVSDLEIHNPNICLKKVSNQSFLNTEFNFIDMNNLHCNNFIELKLFLEESIQACENQTAKLKQTLNFVNNILNNQTRIDVQPHVNEILNEESNIYNYNESSNIKDIIDTSLEKENVTNNISTSIMSENNICTKENNSEIEENLSTSMQILVRNEKINKSNSIEIAIDEARLSTIGETSHEVDDLNNEEFDSQNKENRNDLINIICSSSPQSLPNKFIEDSFTLLENELNVKHNTLPSKSVPTSPTKYCNIPMICKQWDKKVERPLKEYMDLKMNGTFLVTPDVKRFQSCLQPTDTPHSRKSLSRKIFMELCDLYAESPESN